MESVQISPCAYVCEREERLCQQISGLKLGHLQTPTSKSDRLIFLPNKRLLAGTIYTRFLIYLKAIYGQKIKEIDFSTLATKLRFLLTAGALKQEDQFDLKFVQFSVYQRLHVGLSLLIRLQGRKFVPSSLTNSFLIWYK